MFRERLFFLPGEPEEPQLPKNPKQSAQADLLADSARAWQPPGRAITIAGRKIAGMVYTGKPIPPLGFPLTHVEPALIDPSLPIAKHQRDFDARSMMYLSGYTNMKPEARATYLDWLAAGRPPDVAVSYAFEFLSGIERRVYFDALHDPAARAELPVLAAETERLYYLFGEEPDFADACVSLSMAAHLLIGDLLTAPVEAPPPTEYYELPMQLRVMLGTFVGNNKPIPAKWAFNWYLSDPDTNLRTAMLRCPMEFAMLFQQEYQRRFGEGLRIKPSKSRLDHFPIWPSSSSFQQYVSFSVPDLPDVARMKRPQKQLQEVAYVANEALSKYSRAIANGLAPASAAALAVYPPGLIDLLLFPSIAELNATLETALGSRRIGSLPLADLNAHFPEYSNPLSLVQFRNISQLVEQLGFRFEPDPTLERPAVVAAQRVMVIRTDVDQWRSNRDLSAANALMALCFFVAAEAGPVEVIQRAAIVAHVADRFTMNDGERLRMTARAQWLVDRPTSTTGLRKQLEWLTPAEAQQTGRFLIELAGSNHTIGAAEIKSLIRVYAVLGLPESQLHSDLHLVSTHRTHSPAAPKTTDKNRSSKEERILDPAQLRQVQKQTREVSSVLHEVFAEEAAPTEQSSSPAASHPAESVVDPYVQLMQTLASRSTWTRTELDTLAAAWGLMTSGAIETINDRALALGLEPLLDCDDETCDVYESSLRTMLAGEV